MKYKIPLALLTISLIGGGILWAKTRTPAQPTRYVLAAVSRGTVITSLSGSGQVSGQNQIDLKPLVSAEIVKVLVQSGQMVSSSQILFQLDPKDAQKTIRDANRGVSDAQISLASAQLSLRKLQQPPDQLTLIQAEDSVRQAERALDQLKQPPDELDLRQADADIRAQEENVGLSADGTTPKLIRDAYNMAVPTLKTIAQTVTQTLYNADDVLGVDRTYANDTYEQFLSAQDSTKLQQTKSLYAQARTPVRELKALTDRLLAQNEPTDNIDAALQKAQSVLALMDPLTQGVYDILQNTVSSVSLSETTLNSMKSSAQTDHTNITSKLTSLTSLTQALTNARDSYTAGVRALDKAKLALDKLKKGAEPQTIATAEEHLRQVQASLAKIKRGTDPLDLQAAQNTIQQRVAAVADAQNKLHDAQELLNNYTIRAPFEGIVAKVNVKEHDQSSPSTALATLLTQAKIAQISLNEVDVSKVHIGQKATLTFDAVPDLTIAGSVSEIDSIGTVTQGVVNYSVKILFVTQDDRIKPGMSVSAAIITNTHSDVLTIPNSALRTGGTVQVLKQIDPALAANTQGVPSTIPPETLNVQTGLANDQLTEVLSGIQEGDYVVTRTIDPAQQAAAAAARSSSAQSGAAGGLRIPGLTGGAAGGGGNFTRPAGR